MPQEAMHSRRSFREAAAASLVTAEMALKGVLITAKAGEDT
jgi:hypothetical protein